MLRACRHVGQRTRTRALDERRPSARTGGVFCSTGGLIASSYVRDSLRPDSVDCSAHAGWVGISEMASASLGLSRPRCVRGGRVLCAGVHAYTLDYTLLLTRF